MSRYCSGRKPAPTLGRAFRFTEGDMVLLLHPEGIIVRVAIDGSCTSIRNLDVDTTYRVDQTEASTAISNWIDMYGSQLIVWPDGMLRTAGPYTLFIFYQDTINPHRLHSSWIKGTKAKGDSFSGDATSFSKTLDEHDFGSFPKDYLEQFPERARGMGLESSKLMTSKVPH
jgi:hypothetical protein